MTDGLSSMVLSTKHRVVPVVIIVCLICVSDKSTFFPLRSGRWFSTWRLGSFLSMINTNQIMPFKTEKRSEDVIAYYKT